MAYKKNLEPGTVVLAETLQKQNYDGSLLEKILTPDHELAKISETALKNSGIAWKRSGNLTVETPLLKSDEKIKQGKISGASIVQMEDYKWAQMASDLGVPFTSVRVVLDPAETNIPPEVTRLDWREPSLREATLIALRKPQLLATFLQLAFRRHAARHTIDQIVRLIFEILYSKDLSDTRIRNWR